MEKLLSEHPWIKGVTGKRTYYCAEVERLDTAVIGYYARWSSDYVNTSHYYLVTAEGKVLNEVGVKKPKTFFERTVPLLCQTEETIYEGILRTTREYPHEKIKYVLCLEFNLIPSFLVLTEKITLYKEPKNGTILSMVKSFEEKITSDLKV